MVDGRRQPRFIRDDKRTQTTVETRELLDVEARVNLALAANYAGIGFGNAGVHIPHAVAYPIAGLVRDYVPSGYVLKDTRRTRRWPPSAPSIWAI